MSDLPKPLKRGSPATPDEARAAELLAKASHEVEPSSNAGERLWKGVEARLNGPPLRPPRWKTPLLVVGGTALLLAGVARFFVTNETAKTANRVETNNTNQLGGAPTHEPSVREGPTHEGQAASLQSAGSQPTASSQPMINALKVSRHVPTLAEALQLVRSNRYREAEGVYRRIASEVPTEKEIALYALAQMLSHREAAYARALVVLDTLEHDIGDGALAQERSLSRIEILFRMGACDEAKAAVAVYVKRYTHAIDSLRAIDASQCSKASP